MAHRDHHRLGHLLAAGLRGRSGREPVATPWGDALRLARHVRGRRGAAHLPPRARATSRLSNHVTHRANIAALRAARRDAGVLAVTVCGAVDPSVELGSLVCFDDLHFLANRLADGALCTFHHRAGRPRRGHWIYEDPFSAAAARGAARRRRGGRRRGPRRRLLRPRRRAALQHQGRDPRARGLRRDRRLADRRAGDRAVRARRSCRTRCSATRPTTPTASRTRRRRSQTLIEHDGREHGDVRAPCSRPRCRGSTGRRSLPPASSIASTPTDLYREVC